MIKFNVLPTGQISVNVFINSIKELFLIDTGASRTCINKHSLHAKAMTSISTTTVAGLSESSVEMSEANNTFQIGDVQVSDVSFAIIDLKHVNDVFESLGLQNINGIIGADILIHLCAVINYNTNQISFENE